MEGPCRRAHDSRSDHRLGKDRKIVGLLLQQPMDDHQIHQRDQSIAGQCPNRRALDVDLRVPHQHIVDPHLHRAADEHGDDGPVDPSVGLHDGVGQEHDAHEDGGGPQQLQMVGSRQGALPLGGVQ